MKNAKLGKRIFSSFVAMILLTGCTPYGDLLDDAGFRAACDQFTGTYPLPENVPQILLIDDSDPEVASQIPNTLHDVLIGTPIDDLSKLDGCWARQDVNEAEISRQVMKFDLSQGTLTNYALGTPTPLTEVFLPDYFKTDLPFYSANTWEVSLLTNNKLELNLIDGEGAAFESDGKTVFYCPVAGGGSWENYLTAVLSLDGNSLKYSDYYEDIDPSDPANETSAEYWVRIQCP